MSKLLSYDLAYVRGEKCLMKWSIEDGPMPPVPKKCGAPATMGLGIAHDGSMVAPDDPRAVGDVFCCERHGMSVERGLEQGMEGTLAPKTGGPVN
jgi:hypothetical protein